MLIWFLASYSESLSADVSTIFDVGGILGGIFAGAVSDYSGMSASTCSLMLIIAVPLVIYTYTSLYICCYL